MQNIDQVADSLLRIEIELRQLSAWSEVPPPEAALLSDKPFCLDTLEFTEWLQFIFLPKMQALVEQGQRLPTVSGIATMAEEHFRGRAESGQSLIRELEVMDGLLTKP